MRIKNFYQKYWAQKNEKEEFHEYERNWILPTIFKGKEKILDLACGDGAVAEYLQNELGSEVIAADISSNALNSARKRGIKTVLIDVEKKLPFNIGEFDSVFWGDNIEHLFEPQSTLREIKRVLRKRGRLVLSCPNMGYWRYRMYYFINGILPDTEWTGKPPWNWSHIRFFNLQLLKEFLESENFIIKRAFGVNRRIPDKYFSKIFPSLFSMILVIEARKSG